MPAPGVTYTLELKETGAVVAEVRIDDDGARPMVRWNGDADFTEDVDGLAMVMFPDDVGLRVRP